MQQKVLSVESIRGWACFMVLLSHLSLTFYPYLHGFSGIADQAVNPIQHFIHQSPFAFFFSGTAAVYIFFVLSGYILTKVALKNVIKDNQDETEKAQARKRLLSMSLKRYPRLMIPALVSCIIAYVALAIVTTDAPNLGKWINDFANNPDLTLLGALYNGAIDVFFVSGESIYNPVLWTMKVELLGSFVIYLLCLNRVTAQIPYLIGVFTIVTIGTVAIKFATPELGLGIISFYGGYLFCIYGKQISFRLALAALLFGLYLAGAHSTSISYWPINKVLGGYTYFLCNFASGFFIVYAIIFNDRFNQLFSGKLSVFMGKVSFSVYLIQMPILATFTIMAFNGVFDLVGSFNIAAFITSILTIVLTYVLAVVYYHLVDANGMRISNKFAATFMAIKR